MKGYSPAQIEKRWQKFWAVRKLHVTKNSARGKENRMLLVEFPYPSGNLHTGHWYAFALPDMLARFWRMQGYNVMYPIGFDAFGLPAENAAIQRGIGPEVWTKKSIAFMTGQLASMGASFDWSRAVATNDPTYYRWTQWMFLRFWERGLAYRAKTAVNWCPEDHTVLANEQVVDGCCERCGTLVVQKDIEQWMFKTTAFADRLIDDIQGMDWPQTTVLAQRNWIGRSEGTRIRFSIQGADSAIDVFTTRVDTLWGATYVVLAPEHPLVKVLTDDAHLDAVSQYLERVRRKTELERQSAKDKTGIFTGSYAINPINGQKVPVWVADYVLGHYGTGAVMAVPAHDERDYAFAREYNLPIVTVIKPTGGHVQTDCFTDDGVLVDSGDYSGLSSEEARRRMTLDLEEKGAGKGEQNYKLHDWVLSRQRYWGVPIPIVHCAECGYVPVPDKELPVRLPKLKDWKPSPDGRSPLAKATTWMNVKCPRCGGPAERETDTMDTFVDSSWYFMRYTDPANKSAFADPKKLKAWLPVPMYVGGAEHNTMHLLYSRFFTKALYDLGYVPFNEPFTGRRNHGIILGPDGQKMSKSRGNVVDPDEQVKKYGADTVRMYLAFMAPYEQGGPWDPNGITGVHRFLQRVWKFAVTWPQATDGAPAEEAVLNNTIKAVGEDLEHLRLNTAVSGLMKLLNHLEDRAYDVVALETFIKLLAPLAPHLSEELWQGILGKKKSVHLESWPSYDAAKLFGDTMELPVQINGKVRAVIRVPSDANQADIQKAVLADAVVAKNIGDKSVRKLIVIPRRMVSIVVA